MYYTFLHCHAMFRRRTRSFLRSFGVFRSPLRFSFSSLCLSLIRRYKLHVLCSSSRNVLILRLARVYEQFSHRAQNPNAESRGTRDNAGRLRPLEPTRVPLRHAPPSPPQLPDWLHRFLDALIKARSESIEEIVRRRRILFVIFVARMEDTRDTAEMRDIRRRTDRARGLRGEAGKIVDEVYP